VNGAIGYSWTAGATSNTNSATIAESPTVSTSYVVTGINNFNCTTNAQMVIVVRVTPTLTINSTRPLVCIGAPSGLTVSAQAGPCTYTWDPNVTSFNGATSVVNPIATSVYTVLGRATNSCEATTAYTVTVFQPSFSVNTPTSSCLGGTINLIATGANSYTWNGTQPFSQISVSPSTATFYIVAGTSSTSTPNSNVSCVSTNTVFVTIYSNPTVTAVPSRTQICRGEFTDILGSGADTYTLSTGLSGTAIPVNPNSNTTYSITGTDQNGCTHTNTVQVRVSTCFGIDELQGLGNSVSVFPNPSNGNFTLKAERDMELQLVNELGAVIKSISVTKQSGMSVDVEDLATGIYFLKDVQQPFTTPVKIVITR
jgi:hypothetical protein